MKKSLLILLLLLSLVSNAQLRIKHPEAWKTIAVYGSSIALDAVAQGLRDNGNKDWAHVCAIASYVPIAASPFIMTYQRKEWPVYIATYVGLRFMTFDYIYNATRKLPYNYFGSTSVYDRIAGKMGGADGLFMARVVVCSVTLSFTFNNLDNGK
jgi:hypothetical protein